MSAFYEVAVPGGDAGVLPWLQSNISCPGGECALLEELGPPPDMILTLPPPPLPAFLAEAAPALMNESCGLCRWAGGDAVDYVEMPRHSAAIDDTWFFVIICTCIGLTLLGILVAIFCLRLKEQKKARLGMDAADKNKPPPGQCEAVMYPPASHAVGVPPCRTSRALWAGIRTRENHYTVDHAQPVDQKSGSITASSFEFPDDYSSVGYTTISPQAYRAGIPEGVHILPAHDNSGYARSEDSVQVTRVAPDGCVVTPRKETFPLQRMPDELSSTHDRSYNTASRPETEYEHCYEEPGRPLAPDERYHGPAGVDLSLHIYEKPQFHSTSSRSPKNRPKLLNSLNRSSPRPRRAAPSISSPRSLERYNLPPLNARQHRSRGGDDGGRLLQYTPPPSNSRLNVSYPSPVV